MYSTFITYQYPKNSSIRQLVNLVPKRKRYQSTEDVDNYMVALQNLHMDDAHVDNPSKIIIYSCQTEI